MKILIATDGSEHSKEMIEEYSRRVFNPQTEIKIISAYEGVPDIMDLTPDDIRNQYYEMADRYALKVAEEAIEKSVTILRKSNPENNISSAVVHGSPKNAILQEAESFDADLIVLGSKGRGALGSLLLGSVSQTIALHAKCSVEIVRSKKRKHDQVVHM